MIKKRSVCGYWIGYLKSTETNIVHSDQGLMLEMSAFLIFEGGNLMFINFFDQTQFVISLLVCVVKK